MVDGSDPFRNAGRLPALRLRNTQIDMVQDTKLAQVLLHPLRCKGQQPRRRFNQVTRELFRKLIADPKERLGINGVEEIKAHPFFFGINWNKLRERKSPYIPEVKNSWDTQNFDPYEE